MTDKVARGGGGRFIEYLQLVVIIYQGNNKGITIGKLKLGIDRAKGEESCGWVGGGGGGGGGRGGEAACGRLA